MVEEMALGPKQFQRHYAALGLGLSLKTYSLCCYNDVMNST